MKYELFKCDFRKALSSLCNQKKKIQRCRKKKFCVPNETFYNFQMDVFVSFSHATFVLVPGSNWAVHI